MPSIQSTYPTLWIAYIHIVNVFYKSDTRTASVWENPSHCLGLKHVHGNK